MRLLALFVIAGVLLAQAPPAQAPQTPAPPEFTGPRSIGTMSELMLYIIFPLSNELFYVGRNETKSEKEWEDLQNNMLMLAESANILMAENRAKDKDVWMKDARLLWDVGNRAYKAVKIRDIEAMKALNDDLYESCQSCHVHYRPGYKRRL
jgi:hypothetical protein